MMAQKPDLTYPLYSTALMFMAAGVVLAQRQLSHLGDEFLGLLDLAQIVVVALAVVLVAFWLLDAVLYFRDLPKVIAHERELQVLRLVSRMTPEQIDLYYQEAGVIEFTSTPQAWAVVQGGVRIEAQDFMRLLATSYDGNLPPQHNLGQGTERNLRRAFADYWVRRGLAVKLSGKTTTWKRGVSPNILYNQFETISRIGGRSANIE